MERIISISRLLRTHKKILLVGLIAVLLFLYVAIAILFYILLGREPYPGWSLFRLLFLLTILIACIVALMKPERVMHTLRRGRAVSIRRLLRINTYILFLVLSVALLLSLYFKIAILQSIIYCILLFLLIILVVFIIIWRKRAREVRQLNRSAFNLFKLKLLYS